MRSEQGSTLVERDGTRPEGAPRFAALSLRAIAARASLPWHRRKRRERPVSVLSAVLIFAGSGLAALALVSAGVLLLVRQTATDEAIADARRVTEAVGRGVIVPALSDDLAGNPAAMARLDSTVRANVLGPDVVRVKLWAADGEILYSDEPRLLGQRFALAADEVEAFRLGRAAAEVSDLSRPENLYERGWSKLLEVYLPVQTPGGQTLLFEAYLPYGQISASGDAIWRSFLPVLIAGLVVLELVQLPLAWSLARRLRRRQEEREGLLQRAMEASQRERRIIAGELHDGAVQELVAHSYQLAATAGRLEARAPEDAAALREASDRARATVQELRTLLVDLYPLNLQSAGLEAALEDLAVPLRARGLAVTLAVAPGFGAPPEVEQLLYRAAREALRNVLEHAGARGVQVALTTADGRAALSVTDDGAGFDESRRAARRAGGHLGLDLLEALVRDAGGSCRLEREAASGLTRLAVELPLP